MKLIKSILFVGLLFNVIVINAQITINAAVKHIDPSNTVTVGSISLTPGGGTSPYTYSWSPGTATTQNLTGASIGSYTSVVTDNASNNVSHTYNLGYKTFWTNPYGIIFRNDSLIYDYSVPNNVTIFNCAVSKNTLKANTDGWAEVVISSSSDFYLLGFMDSSSVAPGVYSDIDYGFHIDPYSGRLFSWVTGSLNTIGGYSVGDVITIERVSSTFKLKQNGAVVYTLTVPTSKNWKLKASVYGTAIRNIGASFIDTSGVDFPNYALSKPLIHHNSKLYAQDGNIILNSFNNENGYTYSWTPQSISGTSITGSAGSYNVIISDPSYNNSKNNYDILYKTQYDNLEGIIFRNDSLITTTPYPSSQWCTATSRNTLDPHKDGEITWVAQYSTYYGMTGFLDTASTTTGYYNDIDHGLLEGLSNSLYYWSGGYYTLIGNRVPGDVMKIVRLNDTLKYYRNNSIIYSSVPSNANVRWKIKTAIFGGDKTANIGCSMAPVFKTQWTNPYGLIFRNDSLIYDSGVLNYVTIFNCAISKNSLKPDQDGWAELNINSSTNHFLFGFLDSSSVAPGVYTDIDYGVYTNIYTGTLQSWITGSLITIGTYSTGDLVRIERENNVFKIRQNGTVVYTLTVPSGRNWKLKASVSGPPIRNIVASFTDTSSIKFPNYVQNSPLITHSSGKYISDGAISLSSLNGHAGHAYTWLHDSSNISEINNKNSARYAVTTKDTLNNSSDNAYNILYKTNYTNLEGIIFRNDSLITATPYPTTGWCTALSRNTLPAHQDGEIGWVAPQNLYYLVTGFLDTPSSSSGDYYDIDEGLFEQNYAIYYWSAGYYTLLGNRLPGDVMKIKRQNDTVRYYRNESLLYTSAPTNTNVSWKVKTCLTGGYNVANIGCSFSTSSINAVVTREHVDLTQDQFSGSVTITPSGGISPYKVTWPHNDNLVSNTRTGMGQGSYTIVISDSTEKDKIGKVINLGVKPEWTLKRNINVAADSVWVNRTDSLGISVANNLIDRNDKTWFEGIVKNLNHDIAIGFIGIQDSDYVGTIPTFGDSTMFSKINLSYSLMTNAINGTLPLSGSASILNLGPEYTPIHLIRIHNGVIKLLFRGSSYANSYSYQTGDAVKIGRDESGKFYLAINDEILYQNPTIALNQYLFPIIVVDVTFGLADKAILIGPPQNVILNPNIYAVPKRRIDGGFYTAYGGKLLFVTEGEYNKTKLTFNVYNKANQVVLSDMTSPNINNTIQYVGDNRYMLSGLTTLGAGYYILEVINEKKEKTYLRFRVIINKKAANP